MLDALVAVIAALLVLAGIMVMLGPQTASLFRRLRALRPRHPFAGLKPERQKDGVASALNPKTQRVVMAATRLSNWLHTHGQTDFARELRAAAGRLAGDEPAGLYAMQDALRRLRSLALEDRNANEQLRVLSGELRKAVQDRFEQLELLPFGRL
jgi:hypothetical protein